eukprot:TRINITY_DN11234_c0_g1_i8.p1 TRINITY_DN11234_c0_g1~~TRINITY_DN11234_c0_g1_i8.p1  ORF type:complete len:526 (+),score=84.99 TRINITY_DN11234_c0_g1_i8:128-1705(+)
MYGITKQSTFRSFRQHTASDLNTTTQSQSKILDEIKIEKRTSLVKLIAVPTPKIRIQTSFDERDFDVQKELAIPKSPEKKQIPMIPAGSIHYLLSLEDAASKRDEDYPVELPGAKRRMKSLKSFRKTGSFHTKSPQLRFNIKFGKAVKKSWDQLKKDRNGAVPEDEYYRFVRSLVRPLLGDSVTGLELKLSKIDWLHDTKNQNHLDYQAFHEITYLVTDLWSDGIEIDDYLGFLTRISSHYQTLFNEKIATTSPTRSVVVVESDYYLRSKFRAESERRQALEQEAARAEYTYLKHRGLGIVQPDIKGYQSSLVSLPSSYLPSTKINYQFYESFTPKTVINRTLPHLPALDCGASVKLADQGYTEPSANQSDFSEVASSSPDRPGRLSPDRIKNYQQEYLLKLSSLETTAPQSQDLQQTFEAHSINPASPLKKGVPTLLTQTKQYHSFVSTISHEGSFTSGSSSPTSTKLQGTGPGRTKRALSKASISTKNMAIPDNKLNVEHADDQPEDESGAEKEGNASVCSDS